MESPLHRSLSSLEARLISSLEFEQQMLVTLDDIERLTGSSRPQATLLASRLAKKRWLVRVRPGTYQFVPAKMAGLARDDWFVALQAFPGPYYLSFLSAAYHYGLSPQRPSRAQVAVPRRIDMRGERFTSRIEQIQIGAARFFGSTQVTRDGLTIHIAEPEKAVIDAVLRHNRSGGILEVARIVERAATRLDVVKIANYALRMQNVALLQRLGYLLELSGVDPNAGPMAMLASHAHRHRTYLLGSPEASSASRTFSQRWGVVDDVGRERLLSEMHH